MLLTVLSISGVLGATLTWLIYPLFGDHLPGAPGRKTWVVLGTGLALFLTASTYSAVCPEVIEVSHELMPLQDEKQLYVVAAPINHGELYYNFRIVTTTGSKLGMWPVNMISIVEDSTLTSAGYYVETRAYPSVGFGARVQNYDVKRRELRVPPGTVKYTFQDPWSGTPQR